MVLGFYFLVRKGSSWFLPILMAFIPIALALLSAWPEPARISCSPDTPAILPVVSPLPTSSSCGPKLFHRSQAFPSSSRSQTPALSSGLPRTLLLNHVVSLFVPGHARGCGAASLSQWNLSLESSPTWRSLQKATQTAPVIHCIYTSTDLPSLACELGQSLEPSRGGKIAS